MKRKIVYLTLVGDYLNAGHLNILYSAKKLGDVYVGLFTDKAAIQYTALPHQKYEDRDWIKITNNCNHIPGLNIR
jgi:phosphoenolpyruvate phosphomutase